MHWRPCSICCPVKAVKMLSRSFWYVHAFPPPPICPLLSLLFCLWATHSLVITLFDSSLCSLTSIPFQIIVVHDHWMIDVWLQVMVTLPTSRLISMLFTNYVWSLLKGWPSTVWLIAAITSHPFLCIFIAMVFYCTWSKHMIQCNVDSWKFYESNLM